MLLLLRARAGEGVLYEYDEGGQWRERGRGEMRVNVAEGSGQVRGKGFVTGFIVSVGPFCGPGHDQVTLKCLPELSMTSMPAQARLVMRSKGQLRLLMNANLWPDMRATPMDGGKVRPRLPSSLGELARVMHDLAAPQQEDGS